MSQHRSLKTSRAGRRHRTVLKRYERFFALREKDILKDKDSVFGMPKLKIVRVKVKKEKAEEKPEEVQAAAETTAGTSAKTETSPQASKAEKKDERKGKK